MAQLKVEPETLAEQNRHFAAQEVPVGEAANEFLAKHAPGIPEEGTFFYAEAARATRTLSADLGKALKAIDGLLRGTTAAVRESIDHYRTTDQDLARAYDSQLEAPK